MVTQQSRASERRSLATSVCSSTDRASTVTSHPADENMDTCAAPSRHGRKCPGGYYPNRVCINDPEPATIQQVISGAFSVVHRMQVGDRDPFVVKGKSFPGILVCTDRLDPCGCVQNFHSTWLMQRSTHKMCVAMFARFKATERN